MRDAEAIADVVVQTMAAILAPLKASLAATEARVADLTVQLDAVGTLRERVAVAEVKASRELPTVDLTPVRVVSERVSTLETRLDSFATAVTAIETKAALPAPEYPAVVTQVDPVLVERVAGLDARVKAFDGLRDDVGALRERMAAVETRAPIPGPVGPSGADGKDGKDGVNLDDLSVEQQDERTWVIKGTVGARVKEIGSVTLSVPLYRDVWVDGRTYEPGDRVTWGGSEFHCNETTRTKPGESKAWTLAVKRGRDGKDGKDAPVMPVVSVGRGGGHA